MKARVLLAAVALVLAAILSACGGAVPAMLDGYYSSEMAEFDEYGWREYITIYVSGGKIVTVEYNARNASGFIKSWDMDYMRAMAALCGTYPNEYTRTYAVSLLNWQNPDDVDVISGATHSHDSFRMLAEAAMKQARAGDNQVAQVTPPTVGGE